MAKKSSNFGKTLADFLALVLSVVVFGLLAMPFISAKMTILGKEVVSNASGYDLLNFDANAGLATVVLLLIIFASLMAVCAILKLLYDAKIVSNKTFGKVVGLGLILMAFAVVVMAIVAMIVVPSNCEAYSFGSASAGNYAGWFALVLVLVDALAGLIASYFAIKK